MTVVNALRAFGAAAMTTCLMTHGIAGDVAVVRAAGDDIALNGRYRAVSDGQWAKTNDRFHDEATVTSIWTINSSCADYLDCTGRVVSDAGWSADIQYLSAVWYVKRRLDGWEKCPDGSTAAGEQTYKFWPDPANHAKLIGSDKTIAASGACGINKPLVIDIRFTLTPA